MTEQWRPVVGFEGRYEVSDHGRVKRAARQTLRSTGAKYTIAEKVLAQVDHACGYKLVGFKVAKATNRTFLVHRLVAQAFISNPENLPEVNHKDLDKTNNAVSNLEWCSGAQNQRHAALLGRYHGRTNPRARYKLQPADVDAILSQLDAGRTQDAIAQDFGVSQALVSMICLGRVWQLPSEARTK